MPIPFHKGRFAFPGGAAMKTIKAIETHYNGYRFRSRLEARWAVFWDALNIKYVYEPEGFELKDGTRYLPDFYVPEMLSYVEIKPQATDTDEKKCAQLAIESYRNVILIEGTPSVIPPKYLVDYRGVVPSKYECIHFTGTTRSTGYRFMEHEIGDRFYSLMDFLRESGYDTPEYDGGLTIARELIKIDRQYYRDKYGKPHPYWQFDTVCTRHLLFSNIYRNPIPHDEGAVSQRFMLGLAPIAEAYDLEWVHDTPDSIETYGIEPPEIRQALKAAMAARFEHGEHGETEAKAADYDRLNREIESYKRTVRSLLDVKRRQP